MRWWWGPIRTRPTLSWIFIVLAHCNNSLGQTHRPTWKYYPDSEPTSPCSFSLMLSGEATNTNFSWVWPDCSSQQRSTTLEASTLTITPTMRLGRLEIIINTIQCTSFEKKIFFYYVIWDKFKLASDKQLFVLVWRDPKTTNISP